MAQPPLFRTQTLSAKEKAELWRAADTLRGHMDAAEYKHVVLGLIFLKYLSDAFDEYHAELEAQVDEGADPEDRDEYRAVGLSWVPEEARWEGLKARATDPAIGKLVDDAMLALERENPTLAGVLPKQLITDLSNLQVGGKTAEGRDVLGQVYEYFLEKFASAEGKLGGEFYTPASVVKVLVGMLAPSRGRVYDPCCGSGGMFVQSERFVEEHAGKIGDVSVYGQESNPTTWRLARITPCLENGKTAYVDFLGDDEVGFGSTEYIVMQAKPPLPPFWSYLVARHEPFREFAERAMTGTSGRQRVSAEAIARFPIPVPDARVAGYFGELVAPSFALIRANDEESRTLAQLRDTLLPELLSGRLQWNDGRFG